MRPSLALLCVVLASPLALGSPATPSGTPKGPGKARPASPLASPLASKPRLVPGPARRVTVTRVEPTDVVPGDEVTVTGSGFDQGSVLLLGTDSPRALEQSDTRIVFRVPGGDQTRPGAWSAPLYVITPGQTVLNTSATLQVLPASSRVKRAPTPPPAIEPFALQAVVSLARTDLKSWPIDLTGAESILIEVAAASGECEVRVEREGAQPLIRATQGGSIRLELNTRSMKGPGGKPATSATLAIANDAETAVPVRVSVRRVVRKPANAAVP